MSKKYFAVGEKGDNPNIYIYEYPSYKIYRVCRKGTEKAYSALTFNKEGDKLQDIFDRASASSRARSLCSEL